MQRRTTTENSLSHRVQKNRELGAGATDHVFRGFPASQRRYPEATEGVWEGSWERRAMLERIAQSKATDDEG